MGLWQHDDEERKTLFKAIQDVMSGNSNPAMNSTLISATTSHSQPMPPRNPANANVPLKINITPSKAINASVNKTARERNGEEFLTDREISARNAERATKTNEILKSNSNVEKKSASSKSTPVSIPVSMLFNASGSKNGTENDTPKAAGIEKHDHMSELLLSPSDITGTIRKFKKSAN